jgi:hypothetical protein
MWSATKPDHSINPCNNVTCSQKEGMDAKTYIFIGGLHCSGTTLLHDELSGHPLVSGFRNTGVPQNEGQHLQSVYPAAYEYGGPGRFSFFKNAHLDENSDLITPQNRLKIHEQWEKYWDSGKSYFLEKSPPNLIRTRFLQELFPNSHFITLLRHPVATGYALKKWSNDSMFRKIQHWVHAHRILIEDVPHLKHHHFIRYEDLVKTPETVLSAVYSAVGLPFHDVSQTIHSDLNAKYFAMWEEELEKNVILAQLMLPLADVPEQFGYSFEAPYVNDNYMGIGKIA